MGGGDAEHADGVRPERDQRAAPQRVAVEAVVARVAEEWSAPWLPKMRSSSLPLRTMSLPSRPNSVSPPASAAKRVRACIAIHRVGAVIAVERVVTDAAMQEIHAGPPLSMSLPALP